MCIRDRPSFLCAVIRTESKFDTKAVSHADAHGLMQITPDTFDWLKTKLQDGDLYTEEDIYDPKVNIHSVSYTHLLRGKRISGSPLRHGFQDPLHYLWP